MTKRKRTTPTLPEAGARDLQAVLLHRKRTVSRVVTGIRIWATQPMDGQRA